MFNRLSKSLSEVACAIRAAVEESQAGRQWQRSHCAPVTKHDLLEMENRLMSKITEFAAAQQAHNARIDAAVTGLTQDIQALNDKITELQNSPGAITPEDQTLLNDLQARGEAIATKLEALDAQTPPTPPPA